MLRIFRPSTNHQGAKAASKDSKDETSPSSSDDRNSQTTVEPSRHDGESPVQVLVHPTGDKSRPTEGPLAVACFENASLTHLRKLVRQNPKATASVSYFGWLPLHIACSHPHVSVETIRWLVQEYPSALRTACGGDDQGAGYLPLHICCLSKAPVGVVRYLVAKHPDALRVRDAHGRWPLHDACLGPKPLLPVVRLILSHLKPNEVLTTDDHGRTALHLVGQDERSLAHAAAWTPQHRRDAQATTHQSDLMSRLQGGQVAVDIVHLLVDVAPMLLTMVDHHRRPPLYYACVGSPQLSLIEYYLQECASAAQQRDWLVEAPPGTKDHVAFDGNLPLHLACQSMAPLTVIRLLLKEGPEARTMANQEGHWPLHVALRQPVVVASVVSQLCPPEEAWEDLSDDNKEGSESPLHVACANRRISIEVLECLADHLPVFLWHQSDAQGRTPMQVARQSNLSNAILHWLYRYVSKAPGPAMSS